MHGGTIGVAVGYFLVFTLYNRSENIFKLNMRSWFAIIAILAFSVFLSNYMNVFGSKFEGIDSENAAEVLMSSYEKTEKMAEYLPGSLPDWWNRMWHLVSPEKN